MRIIPTLPSLYMIEGIWYRSYIFFLVFRTYLFLSNDTMFAFVTVAPQYNKTLGNLRISRNFLLFTNMTIFFVGCKPSNVLVDVEQLNTLKIRKSSAYVISCSKTLLTADLTSGDYSLNFGLLEYNQHH